MRRRRPPSTQKAQALSQKDPCLPLMDVVETAWKDAPVDHVHPGRLHENTPAEGNLVRNGPNGTYTHPRSPLVSNAHTYFTPNVRRSVTRPRWSAGWVPPNYDITL